LQIRRWLALMLVAAVALTTWPVTTLSAQGESQNLLQDGDFEWSVPWDQQDHTPAKNVAPAWRGWWVSKPPADIKKPYNCGGTDYGCYWAEPEYTAALKIADPYRVHGGLQAQKYFTYGRMHQAGLMQKVGDISPGARVRFSIYMHAWMCFDYDACQHGKVSDKPSDMHLKIGIDPTGGDNPFSPDIVWSSEQAAWDEYVLFQVEAVAKNNAVTVFTHSRADWDWARTNNDVYLDDASLVVIGQEPLSTPTRPPAPAPRIVATVHPKATATPSPTNTSTPTITPTPTDTPEPTETLVPRVVTLPPEDTATSTPQSLLSNLTGSGADSPGGLIGVILLAAASFLGALLVGIVIGQRRNVKTG